LLYLDPFLEKNLERAEIRFWVYIVRISLLLMKLPILSFHFGVTSFCKRGENKEKRS
jgi:hypothetical protein